MSLVLKNVIGLEKNDQKKKYGLFESVDRLKRACLYGRSRTRAVPIFSSLLFASVLGPYVREELQTGAWLRRMKAESANSTYSPHKKPPAKEKCTSADCFEKNIDEVISKPMCTTNTNQFKESVERPPSDNINDNRTELFAELSQVPESNKNNEIRFREWKIETATGPPSQQLYHKTQTVSTVRTTILRPRKKETAILPSLSCVPSNCTNTFAISNDNGCFITQATISTTSTSNVSKDCEHTQKMLRTLNAQLKIDREVALLVFYCQRLAEQKRGGALENKLIKWMSKTSKGIECYILKEIEGGIFQLRDHLNDLQNYIYHQCSTNAPTPEGRLKINEDPDIEEYQRFSELYSEITCIEFGLKYVFKQKEQFKMLAALPLKTSIVNGFKNIIEDIKGQVGNLSLRLEDNLRHLQQIRRECY